MKNYLTWTCTCGYDDNRNSDNTCKSCGKPISCKQAGGHQFNVTSENPNPECIRKCGSFWSEPIGVYDED